MERRRQDRAADVAMRRRVGARDATGERIRQSFLEADDLRSQCRACGHRRVGTLAAVSGPCPACGFSGAREGSPEDDP